MPDDRAQARPRTRLELDIDLDRRADVRLKLEYLRKDIRRERAASLPPGAGRLSRG